MSWPKVDVILNAIKNSSAQTITDLKPTIDGIKTNFDTWKTDWTAERAEKLDNLDAPVSTRADQTSSDKILKKISSEVSWNNIQFARASYYTPYSTENFTKEVLNITGVSRLVGFSAPPKNTTTYPINAHEIIIYIDDLEPITINATPSLNGTGSSYMQDIRLTDYISSSSFYVYGNLFKTPYATESLRVEYVTSTGSKTSSGSNSGVLIPGNLFYEVIE